MLYFGWILIYEIIIMFIIQHLKNLDCFLTLEGWPLLNLRNQIYYLGPIQPKNLS